jgi:ergothioneine biosynthesis protein EgtB
MQQMASGVAVQERTSGTPSLAARYTSVRGDTEALCAPLHTEDYVVSSMPDVSPAKWHLAHTSWFFEQFVLTAYDRGYRSPDARYAYLFNSYYVQAGERHCRAQRGLVTRPGVDEVFAYRRHVDDAMCRLLHDIGDDRDHPAASLIELGLHHEQQHQELLLTDIKHVFWMNPLRPAYREEGGGRGGRGGSPLSWITVPEGIYWIGCDDDGFAFDNERPRHRVFLEACRLASRLVTNREYLAFLTDGGYHRANLWLAAGYALARSERWEAPLYWERSEGTWIEFTLGGMRPLDGDALDDPVCHLSYYEADAFARWAGCRLPTEFEWEAAAAAHDVDGHFAEGGRFHPRAAEARRPLDQLYGDAWQWTHSSYLAYPKYRPPEGAIGEYNGKWMADQWVLRGASCATPRSHARCTYRNFFPSAARWQFTGIRLATGVET